MTCAGARYRVDPERPQRRREMWRSTLAISADPIEGPLRERAFNQCCRRRRVLHDPRDHGRLLWSAQLRIAIRPCLRSCLGDLNGERTGLYIVGLESVIPGVRASRTLCKTSNCPNRIRGNQERSASVQSRESAPDADAAIHQPSTGIRLPHLLRNEAVTLILSHGEIIEGRSAKAGRRRKGTASSHPLDNFRELLEGTKPALGQRT